jgi:hypothetical protein
MSHELQSTTEEVTLPIEDYLDRVVAPLAEEVPHARRRELRAELGAHLEALVAAHLELGAIPEEAVSAALQQFGSPRAVGQEWLRSWRRVEPARPASPLRTAGIGLLCFLPASLFAWLANNAAVAIGNSQVAGWLLFNSLLFPVAAGLLTGLLSRRRHGFGALLGCAAAAFLCGVFGALQDGSEWAEPRHFPLAALAATQIVFWLPLAALAGAVGGSLRRGTRDAVARWASD